MYSYIIAYDNDCGPCRRFRKLVSFLDINHHIDFISIIEASKLGLLDEIPNSLWYKSFHLISPNGSVQSGGEALPILIRLFPLGGPISKLIKALPGSKWVMVFVYPTLSRLRTVSSCSLKQKVNWPGLWHLTVVIVVNFTNIADIPVELWTLETMIENYLIYNDKNIIIGAIYHLF